jgi:ubiquinone/menaquinone biosynthesis C-methylase UbiE
VIVISAKSFCKSKKRNIPGRLAGSRLVWNYILGPGYNKHIMRIGREFYSPFIDTVVDGSEIPPKARILDVGSGPGLLALVLAEKYPDAEVVGVDYSPKQVRAADNFLSNSRFHNCSFEVGNAVDLPFQDGSFDVVVSTWSISCWPDIKKGLEEIRRVLVDDGKAFIVDADSSSTEEEVGLFTRAYAEVGNNKRLTEWFTRRFVFGPTIAITNMQAEAMAKAAGFGAVLVEKKPGLPFFQLKLSK